MARARTKSKHASTKLDISALRRIIDRQTPMTVALGVVRQFDGETSHFEILTDADTGITEVMVDVELQPTFEKVFCRLGFGHDQVYKIPRLGQEVAVLIPQLKNPLVADEMENDPIIVAVLDTQVPAQLDGDDVVVISAPRVIVDSTSIQLGANATAAPTLAQVTRLYDAIKNAVPATGAADGGAALQTNMIAILDTPSFPDPTTVVTTE